MSLTFASPADADTADAAAPRFQLFRGFEPGYLGRILQMHGEYYAVVWGSGSGFEALMAREMCDFHDAYDPARDLLLTAHVDGVLVGSVAILGPDPAAEPAEEAGAARLRWFIMDTGQQGKGIGSALLREALRFCEERGFTRIYLWTVEGLPLSRHLYERTGFRIVERHIDTTYTVEHTHLKMVLDRGATPDEQ